MVAKICLILAALWSAKGNAAATKDQFCKSIEHAVASDHEVMTAHSFCNSYLGVEPRTSYATKTITSTVVHVVLISSTEFVTTTTLTEQVASHVTATVTDHTSTSYVSVALTGCTSPISATPQQLRASPEPSAFHGLPSSSLSKACKCFSFAPSTRTVTTAKTTTTVTKTRTFTVEEPATKSATAFSTTIETATKTVTGAYTTTVTRLMFTGIALLANDTDMFASARKDGPGDHAFFSQDSIDNASSFGLTESGLLVFNGFNAIGVSSFSPDYVQPTWGGSVSGDELQCTLNRNDGGYCNIACPFNGYDTNYEFGQGEDYYWVLIYGEQNIPGAFSIIAVGGLTT